MATDGTLDAALARALADEVASVFPELTSGSDATSPTSTEEITMQPYVGFAAQLQAAPSGRDKELVRRMKAREKERRRYYRNKVGLDTQYLRQVHGRPELII